MSVKKWSVLMLAGVLAVTSAACSDDEDIEGPTVEVFTANLLGTNENPAVTTTATGSARVEFTPTGLIYSVNVANLQNVTLAHIHGPAATTANAGVILNLNPVLGTVNGVLAAGTATGPGTSAPAVSMDSLKVLIRNGLAYVNVHNQANLGGHIRGQLVKQ